MLRFDENAKRRPRNFLLRREQTRLLVLVGLLGVVVLLMQRVRSPESVALLDRVFGSAAAPSTGASPPATRDAPPGPASLARSLYAGVTDNSPFRAAETEAWFGTLEQLQQAPPPSDSPPASYAQLVSQPDAYRGRAVRIEGALRRVEAITPAENTLGIETLYRLIIQPRGGQVWPITVYSIASPPGVAPGDDVDQPMRTVGYFFKNQSYRWQDGVGVTPVVLASSPGVLPQETPRPEPPSEPPALLPLMVSAGVVSGLLVAFLAFRSSGGPPRKRFNPGQRITIGDGEAQA